MKIKRKILVSILLALTIISTLCSSFAFEIGEKNLVSLGECERYLTFNGNPVKTTYIALEKDGVMYPAYCLDVTKPGIETSSYTVNGGSKIQDVNVWRAIINGFPYKSVTELGAANEQEAFTATKHAVYTMLYNRDTSAYGAVDSDAGRRTYQIYLNIVNAARGSSENIINQPGVKINSERKEWIVDEKDKTYVSKIYSISSNVNSGNYVVNCEGSVPQGAIVTDMNNQLKNNFGVGEKFKVLIPIQSMVKEGDFTIHVKANLETKPVVYGSTNVPGTQDYALTGYMFETAEASLKEDYFKNITKLIVIKKEYGAEKRLEGVKFELLNDKKEVVMQDLVTNENGEIILENMIPGIYFLKETETLENYNLYTDLAEIDLDLNEEYQFTLNNVVKEEKEYEKTFEVVEVVPTYEVETYEVKNIEKTENITNVKSIKKLPVTGY